MKVMSIGAGFISQHLPYEKIDHRIKKISDVDYILAKYKPDVLINCIGKTGNPNIDWCENNKDATAFANIVVPTMIAEKCNRDSIRLIQIGSGCIFFGKSPNTMWVQPQIVPNMDSIEVDLGWKEENFANPQSYYSKTKYACDLALGDMKNVTTLRIRMPISDQNHKRNLINKLLNYNQIIDVPNSVTFMSDFVRCVDWIINKGYSGTFHITNPQPLTAARIMKEFQKYVPKHKFEIISEQQLDQLTIAKRSNCILDSQKLTRLGFFMTNSEEALSECMKSYVQKI